MTFSLFGDKFTRYTGITRLMNDLNEGLRIPGATMLGGGAILRRYQRDGKLL